LCEKIGANVQDVAKGMGLDGRIGRYFLHAGPGYGGSCFPKDTHALLNIGREWGVDLGIVDAVIKANDNQKARMVDKIKENMGDVKGKKICVLGLAFKPETDDVREAPAVTIIKGLYDSGAKICAFDPIAMENAKKLALPDMDIEYAADEYSAAKDADALVLVTEWNQFRSMDIERLAENMKGDQFFDLRNVYQKKLIEKYGLRYYGVGK
jgi:UDPglucose 6-dehydrogenase